MAPVVFENAHFDYVQEHLRIMSAFYGVLKPMDGITPYRLEMQARAAIGHYKNLYEFWGDKLITKGTYAKMARGEMVRYMAENHIEKPEDIRSFNRLGYVFRDKISSGNEYIFERIVE